MIITRLFIPLCIKISVSRAPHSGTSGESVISHTSSSLHVEDIREGTKHSRFVQVKEHVEGDHRVKEVTTQVDGRGETRTEECTGGVCHVKKTPITGQLAASSAHAAGEGIIHPTYTI
jgi:hypothetical protein